MHSGSLSSFMFFLVSFRGVWQTPKRFGFHLFARSLSISFSTRQMSNNNKRAIELENDEMANHKRPRNETAAPSSSSSSSSSDASATVVVATPTIITLTEEQQHAVSLIREGHNVFLTGEGGSGKSFTTQKIKEALAECAKQKLESLLLSDTTHLSKVGKDVVCNIILPYMEYLPFEQVNSPTAYWVASCAPTGIAGSTIESPTLHKLAGLRPEHDDPERFEVRLAEMKKEVLMYERYTRSLNNRTTIKEIGQSAVFVERKLEEMRSKPSIQWLHRYALIIDEGSMLQIPIFQQIDRMARELRGIRDKPFGGLQILIVADMLQIGPMPTDFEKKKQIGGGGGYKRTPYVFECSLFWDCKFEFVELTTNHRQNNDLQWQTILNQIRVLQKGQRLPYESIAALAKRSTAVCPVPSVQGGLGSMPPLFMHSHNDVVREHNNKMIDQMTATTQFLHVPFVFLTRTTRHPTRKDSTEKKTVGVRVDHSNGQISGQLVLRGRQQQTHFSVRRTYSPRSIDDIKTQVAEKLKSLPVNYQGERCKMGAPVRLRVNLESNLVNGSRGSVVTVMPLSLAFGGSRAAASSSSSSSGEQQPRTPGPFSCDAGWWTTAGPNLDGLGPCITFYDAASRVVCDTSLHLQYQVTVRFSNGEFRLITPHCFSHRLNPTPEDLADPLFVSMEVEIWQIPLTLNWASTAHSAQSLTLHEGAEIDCNKAFCGGLSYTMFSRVPSLDRLYLRNFDESWFGPSPYKQRVYAEPIALEFYRTHIWNKNKNKKGIQKPPPLPQTEKEDNDSFLFF